MKTKLLTYSIISLGFLATLSQSHAAVWASDDFESNTLTGGSGNWTTDWTHGGAGGSFVNSGSEIEGTYSGALYTSGGGVSTLKREFTTLDSSNSGTVGASWSIKGLANMQEIGVNLIGSMSNGDTYILTMKFDVDFTDGLRMDNGGDEFTTATEVDYANGSIFDFTFSSEIGSEQYTWSVASDSGASASQTYHYNYDGAGLSLTSFSAIEFFWEAPNGTGNDGLIDNVSLVPEPSSAIAGLLLITGLMHRRR
ncbi:MAG: hypothetical protein ACQCXQ_10925 [Verrucomicrobiales bacterium]|nr:hypothetical protein [Verrucomicrobiota bacterium JB025]